MIREDLPSLITTSPNPVGVELGVAGGKFSIQLLERYNFKRFYCVDSWNSRSHRMKQYLKAYNKLKSFKAAHIIRATFEEFLCEVEDNYFDFIFIDGYAHTGQDDGKTIEDWYCKLKPGGIYSGHDYWEKYPLTIKYVDIFAKNNNKKINITSENRFNSWWIVK